MSYICCCISILRLKKTNRFKGHVHLDSDNVAINSKKIWNYLVLIVKRQINKLISNNNFGNKVAKKLLEIQYKNNVAREVFSHYKI